MIGTLRMLSIRLLPVTHLVGLILVLSMVLLELNYGSIPKLS
jgi:hypothetical protein